MKPKTRQTLLLITGIILAMALYGGIMVLYSMTLIKWWYPVLISLALALFTWIPLDGIWRRITRLEKKWARALCHFAIMAGVWGFAFLGINYFGADTSSNHTVYATVIQTYRKESNRTRRVGRRLYVSRRNGWNYYAQVSIPGSGNKELSLTASQYAHMRKGKKMKLSIEKGALGFDILRRQ